MIINQVITGGGGSATSTIIVTAPTGSTVTLTNPRGQTTTGVEVSGTWTFSGLAIFGSYTVTATLGSNSKTQTVLVDIIGTFNVTISYRLYLYNEGNECSAVSGGWNVVNLYGANSNLAISKRSDSFLLQIANVSMEYWCKKGIATGNMIDLTPYSKLYYEVIGDVATGKTTILSATTTLYDTISGGDISGELAGVNIQNSSGAKVTNYLDISGVNSSAYIMFWTRLGYGSSRVINTYVYNAWLE